MRILILMPCDERSVYMASGIYKNLPEYGQERTFAMPMFMDYLMITKTASNWTEAFFYTLLSVHKLLNTPLDNSNDEVQLVIGNVSTKYKFDIIMNFQDIEQSLPYEDKFLEQLITVLEDDAFLLSKVLGLYSGDSSILALQNCEATAQLISDLFASDNEQQQQALQEQYKEKINFIAKVGPDVSKIQ